MANLNLRNLQIPRNNERVFPYQADWINCRDKFAVWEKSVRIGGTWSTAILAVHVALETGWNVWFSSSDLKNGLEFIRYVYDYCQCLNGLLGRNYIALKNATSECVLLPNQSRISCLSSNPTSLRGKDGLIILDELSFHEAQEELLRVAVGRVAQRGMLRVLSTHNGICTFEELCRKSPANGWTKFTTTMETACRNGYLTTVQDPKVQALKGEEQINYYLKSLQKSCLSNDVYQQEFCCSPLANASLISPSQYDALTLWDVPSELDRNTPYNSLYAGIDIGVSDWTCCWIVEEFENPKATGEWDKFDYKTVAVKVLRNIPLPQQFPILSNLLSHPQLRRCLVDSGAIGYSLSQALESAHPLVEGYGFTAPRKAVMAERIKGLIEQQRLSLPKDEIIRDDLLALKRFDGNRYEGRSSHGSHSDCFWACGLALEAATTLQSVTLMHG